LPLSYHIIKAALLGRNTGDGIMKRIVLALAFLACASGVQAQQRPSTLNLTCGQARQTILSRGAAVLSTGTYTYDRFVRDRNFCEFNEELELAFVPTRDTPQCPIGYRCRSDDLDFFDD
jgi:hypothetical protein